MMGNYVVNVTKFCPKIVLLSVCSTNAQMSNIYSSLYDLSLERKHPFDLNQCYGSLSTPLPKVMIIYTWINSMVH